MSAPKVGERVDDPGSPHVMEWLGNAWAPVCPGCNVAMTTRDAASWLCCGVCGARSTDVNRFRGEKP